MKSQAVVRSEKLTKSSVVVSCPLPPPIAQVPLYSRGARPGDARPPEMFCYYVIQPGGEDYPVGLLIADEADKQRIKAIFGGAEMKRFSYFTREELNACLDEAAEIAEDIFAERTTFDRTDDRDRCARCYFQRVCERTVG